MRIVTRVILSLCLLGASLLGVANSAAVAPSGLSIHIDDSVTEADAAQELVYTAQLRNTGATTVDATVVVTVPDYLEVTSVEGSDAEGVIDGGTATWPASVGPGETITFVTAALVGTIPSEERRVTTIVSVYLPTPNGEDRGAPLIRSADSNRIVGIDDAGMRTDAADPPTSGVATSTVLFVSVGAFCVLLGAAAFFYVAYRRSRAPRK